MLHGGMAVMTSGDTTTSESRGYVMKVICFYDELREMMESRDYACRSGWIGFRNATRRFPA